MGAYDFTAFGYGTNVREVYESVCQDAIDNGTHPNHLRQKGQLKQVALPAKATVKNIEDFTEQYLNRSPYSDKYGPMYYFEFPKARKAKVKVPSGAVVKKNTAKGVRKWETVYSVSYEEFKYERWNTVTKDFKTGALANAFAKELAAKGIHSTIDIAKKLTDPKLARLADVSPKMKEVNQSQSLFVFFSMLPS